MKELVGLAKVQNVLKNAQGKRKKLSIDEATNVIQMSGGFAFPPGTRIIDILQQMADCNLIELNQDAGILRIL